MRQGRERIRRSREKTFHRVVVEGCARADDGNLFDYRLRNDEPVKRVTMMKRQCRQRCRMAGLDRQNQKTVLNNARSRNDSNGSFSLYLPMLILIATSQYTAGLISFVVAASSIRLRAVELSCASPSTNQRKVCVSRSIFIACTRQNLSSAHRLRPELPGPFAGTKSRLPLRRQRSQLGNRLIVTRQKRSCLAAPAAR